MKIKILFVLYLVIFLFSCSEVEDTEKLISIDRMVSNGEYSNAIEECKKYLKSYPESFKGWNLLGWVYLKTDRIREAEQTFNKSISINDKWDNAYVGKGVIYRKMGDLDKARQNYLKAISLVSNNAEAFSSLLVIELKDGNDKKAVEYGEKAWKLRKNLPSIPANLAIAYHYLGDFKKRDKFYKIAENIGYHKMHGLEDIINNKVSIR